MLYTTSYSATSLFSLLPLLLGDIRSCSDDSRLHHRNEAMIVHDYRRETPGANMQKDEPRCKEKRKRGGIFLPEASRLDLILVWSRTALDRKLATENIMWLTVSFSSSQSLFHALTINRDCRTSKGGEDFSRSNRPQCSHYPLARNASSPFWLIPSRRIAGAAAPPSRGDSADSPARDTLLIYITPLQTINNR